ncbi:hypothetical protein EVG20_g4238 [Dentipellis fragilis]|uniref:Protein kinase domain-containing protein n=1 Tax=Dentipellis fragilis TaxID=205917 RepID=A0A4Y9YYV9_9AGAM|nr:hypothetical protein EVG20_g4238 [Dentipellis fragilis]
MVSSSLPKSTPHKTRTPCNDPVRDNKPLTAKLRYVELAKDMARQFLGPMPVEDFLGAFLPKAPTPRPTGIEPFKCSEKKKYETEFVRAAMDANICPDLEFVSTTKKEDKTFVYAMKPDISVIPRHRDADALPSDSESDTNWTNVELFIERKRKEEDPFKDPSPKKNRKDFQFLKDGDAPKESRGQMIAYAGAHFAMQFRAFCFSVCIIGTDKARLIRWDRGGAVVTERFSLVDKWDWLLEFFWRFNYLDSEGRGRDTSVVQATPEEVEMAKAFFPDEPTLHKIRIMDDRDHTDRYFLVARPTEYNISVCGRATRGFKAFDMEKKDMMWLKDSWRIDVTAIPKEYEIYKKLHEHKVSNIPDWRCGGDVEWQKTRTHEFQDSLWRCGEYTIMPHQHYRLVLEVIVGRPLHEYRSTEELCRVILDALIALGEACSRAKVLHRDISGGNVLITEDGRGVLIDWDLSKEVKEGSTPRRDWRTGTWRFISIALLRQKRRKEVHEHCDDLESILWLVTYYALRYQPAVAAYFIGFETSLDTIFDQAVEDKDGEVYGGDGKDSYLGGSILKSEDLNECLPPSLAGLLEDLRRIFRDAFIPNPYMPAESRASARTSIQTMDAIRAVFEKRLLEENWPKDDGAVEPLLLPAREKKAKRGHDEIDEDEEDEEDGEVDEDGRLPSGASAPKRSKVSELAGPLRSRSVRPSSLASGSLSGVAN